MWRSSSVAPLGFPPSVSIGAIKAAFITAWVIVSFFIGAFLTAGIFFLLDKTGVDISGMNESVETAVKSGVMYTLAVVIALGTPWLIRRSRADKKLLGLDRLPEWSDILLGPLGYIPYFVLTLIFTAVAIAVIPGFDIAEVQDTGFQTVTNQIGYMMAFLTLVVVAPFAEEVLMRGYLYGKLRTYIGVIAATVLVSLCFALLHLQLNVAIDVFALSIVLCVLRELTGSIWAGVLLHMTKNFIAFYFLFVAPLF